LGPGKVILSGGQQKNGLGKSAWNTSEGGAGMQETGAHGAQEVREFRNKTNLKKQLAENHRKYRNGKRSGI